MVYADLALSAGPGKRGRFYEYLCNFVELRREFVFIFDEAGGPFYYLANRRRG